MKTQQKGFTLIELLITIAIIATIAAFAIPSLLGYLEGTRQSAVVQNCELAKRVIKAEHVKSYSNAQKFDLRRILNGGADGVTDFENANPYDDSQVAFSVADGSTVPAASAGQVVINIDPAIGSNTPNFSFDSQGYTASITCDANNNGTVDAGETETVSLQL